MDFTPLNEQQLKELNLYPEGKYRFKVIRTEQKRSQSGLDYFNLRMNIDLNGKWLPLFDMLFFEGKMLYKTKHFCDVTGMEDKYNAGKLMPFDCDNKEGWLELNQRVNQKTGELQNNVKDYIVEEVNEAKPDDFIDDELPI